MFALVITFTSISFSVHAASSVTLTAPSHRHLDGTFTDDKLATELTPSGKYGNLIYNSSKYVDVWRIDPSFIEDIQAMTVPYKVSGIGATSDGVGKDVANAWLNQLRRVIAVHRVEAVVYANPSEYWINKFMPHDRGFLLSVSASRLSNLLQHFVYPSAAYDSQKYFPLISTQVRLMKISNARIQASASFLDSTSLETYKLSEVKLLNPTLTTTQRQLLAYDLAAQVNTLTNSIRISSGKFTITSTNQRVPITVINDFPKPVLVNLTTRSTNERVFVGDIPNIAVPAKSKIQVMVPIKVYTSGDSGFVGTLTTKSGAAFGQTVTYPLKIAVISGIATWITTIAAVILFGAAILQSLRRIRRGSNKKEGKAS